MPITLNGSTGVVFPAGGTGNTAGAAVGTTDTQTLTNKTLTSPTISGATINSSTINGGSITLATAQASTSGTNIDFTGIPSWAKRITVMFNGVSTSGTDDILVQIGSGSVSTSGYLSSGSSIVNTAAASTAYTNSFGVRKGGATGAAVAFSGAMVISLLSGTTYEATWMFGYTNEAGTTFGGGNSPALSGALDRVRITTSVANTFDAGTINIMYEG